MKDKIVLSLKEIRNYRFSIIQINDDLYINEKDLQKVQGLCEEWAELVRPINVALQDELGFIHPITYRVYRSWEDLEEYQIIGISKARRSLEESCDV